VASGRQEKGLNVKRDGASTTLTVKGGGGGGVDEYRKSGVGGVSLASGTGQPVVGGWRGFTQAQNAKDDVGEKKVVTTDSF
jgi:hypothetical protein